MTRMFRSAWVIARRDFTATVLSKAFIFFLLGPVFPLLLGGVFGGIGARVASQTEKPVVAVIASPADFERLDTARNRLAAAIDEDRIVELVREDPQKDIVAQQRQLLARKRPSIAGVLTGGLESPHVVGSIGGDGRIASQLRLILADARSREPVAPPLAMTKVQGSSAALSKGRALTGQIGQMLLFFLTILLSGMVMSQLIEEKSNKIIEVIAAAVPIDALFVGKLFAMLAASVLGIIVWVSAGALLIQMVKHGGVATLPPPAVGWPAFLGFAVVYFAMNYLLLGALFLTIGAQASTVREVQTMSMPVTFAQVIIFGFAATAIGAPDSTGAIFAAIFPFSSPMVMLARAAEEPEVWPHLLAIAWQAFWVALILRMGAKLFRRTVLKSGPRTRWWRLRNA
jgi:ABC-2 type transport system permease protein